VAANTLGRVQDLGKDPKPSGAVVVATHPATRKRAATWASDDVLPALSRRAAELEMLAKSLQTDLDRATERLAAYSEFDATLERALVDAYVGAQEIRQKARTEADATLERALDERRLALKDVDRLRGERDNVTDEIASVRRGRFMPLRAAPETAHDPVPDHRARLAAEMRVILAALFEESLGPRPAPITPSVRRPPTLLRAFSLAPARPRREPPPSQITPAPLRPIVAPVIADPRPLETARTDAVFDPIAPVEPMAAVVAPEIVAMIETPPDAPLVPDVMQAVAPIVDEAETFAITASIDVPAAIEPEDAVITDVTEVVIEMDEDPRAIAVRLVEALPTEMRETRPVAEPEPPVNLAETEPVAYVAEPVQDMPAVGLAELLEAAPRIETREIVEEPVLAPPPPEAEAEVARPIDAKAITDLWETALGTTQPTEAMTETSTPPVAAMEIPAAPTEIQAEPASAEPMPIVEGPSNVELPIVPAAQPVVGPRRAAREIQLVLSPVTSFPQLLAIQHRIAALSSVSALHLRDFRNGVATFAAGVTDAMSGREFGSALQMLGDLPLRLEGATDNGVELRVDPQMP
jgi:hypothetical protein